MIHPALSVSLPLSRWVSRCGLRVGTGTPAGSRACPTIWALSRAEGGRRGRSRGSGDAGPARRSGRRAPVRGDAGADGRPVDLTCGARRAGAHAARPGVRTPARAARPARPARGGSRPPGRAPAPGAAARPSAVRRVLPRRVSPGRVLPRHVSQDAYSRDTYARDTYSRDAYSQDAYARDAHAREAQESEREPDVSSRPQAFPYGPYRYQ